MRPGHPLLCLAQMMVIPTAPQSFTNMPWCFHNIDGMSLPLASWLLTGMPGYFKVPLVSAGLHFSTVMPGDA